MNNNVSERIFELKLELQRLVTLNLIAKSQATSGVLYSRYIAEIQEVIADFSEILGVWIVVVDSQAVILATQGIADTHPFYTSLRSLSFLNTAANRHSEDADSAFINETDSVLVCPIYFNHVLQASVVFGMEQLPENPARTDGSLKGPQQPTADKFLRLAQSCCQMVKKRFLDLQIAVNQEAIEQSETAKAHRDLLKSALLKDSELADKITTNIVFVDADLRIQWANKAAANSVGRFSEEMVGKACYQFWGNATTTCTDCPSQIARRTKQIAQSIVYKPDGSVWDERSEPILDSENNIVGFLEITQNISSKVQRDNALRQVEHKLSTVFKLLDVGISITDQVGNIIDCNNASEAILGITKEEHLARNYAGKQWDIIRPDYSPMPPEEFASVRALTDKCTVRDVVMGVRKPSGLCWISVNASPLDIPGYGVVITYIDITASVTARAALQESEMKFRSVFEHSIDSIVVLHAGRCLFVNPAFYSLFNYDENDTIIGQAILSFIARPERIKFVALSRKIENKEIAESRMYCLGIKKDGSEFHISLSISSYDLNGKNYILAILRDVSESKRAEIALRESREQFASAFEYAAIGKALVSTQGQFMKVNKALCAFLGYTADELMALTFQEITHPDDLNLDLRYLGEMLDGTRDCYQMEKRYFAKNGKLVWVLLSVSLVKTDTEEPLHFISQIQDITHRKRAEQSLLESEANFKDLAETVRRQNLELQKLNSDKDLFISIIAHDLKSPFSSILGFTKLLLKNFVNYSPEKIVKQLQLIESSAKNTYNLLEEILHWARAQSGKLPFEPIFFNLHQNIQENIENLSLFARGKQITISNTVPQAYIVCADANMINTVLRNLLSNAIKFTNPKGQIQISAQRTEGNTRVSITDNGIGIDPLKLAQLFVVSHKTSTQGTAQESGTGLGLPICKELIEIHGGEIWAKSKPNEGSKFTFTLPKTLKFTPQKLD